MLRSFTIIILATLSLTSSVSAESRPLLGVQRWDMYSGKGTTQAQELGYLPGAQGFLKSAEWHDRAPFFCRLTADVDGVTHPKEAGPLWYNYPFCEDRLQADMDQEIRYAHGAGIDFFIYHGPARTLFANGWELRNNLDAHMASRIPEAQEMNFVWALYGHEAIDYTRSKVALMIDDTIAHMTKPNWQTVMDGRPLLPVLWPDNFKQQLAAAKADESMTAAEFVAYLRSRVQEAGLKNPYIVGMEVPAKSFQRAAAWKEDGYDAFSDYAGGYGGATARRDEGPTYAQATETLMEAWAEDFVGQALPSIPPCSSMQYPWPRALDAKHQPVDRWYHYLWPKKGDLAARVRAALNFVADHPEDCEAQTIFMYSWNEHSEGGGLCPTMGRSPDYHPDTRWLDEVAKALSGWKNDRIFTEAP